MLHDIYKQNIKKHPIINRFNVNGNELVIGGIRVSDIVSKHGTPIYIYDYEKIAERVEALKKYLPYFDLYYSFKANPNLTVCNIIKNIGIGAEVSSIGELQAAKRIGYKGNRIIFNNPAKSIEEIEYSIDNGIFLLNVESLDELEVINAIAKKKNKKVNVSLRINTGTNKVEALEVMMGKNAKFGIKYFDIKDDIVSYSNVNIKGIHVYIASQILNKNTIINNFSEAVNVFKKLHRVNNINLEYIDFGGGFGIPYDNSDKELDLYYIGKKLGKIIDANRNQLLGGKLILELGRYIVGAAGIFVTSVKYIKENNIIVDGGINNFFRSKFLNINHPTYIVNKLNKPVVGKVNICGPLCTPLDTLSQNVKVPRINKTDLVGIFLAGAYGYSMSLLNFISFNHPAEVLIKEGKCYLIRRRGHSNDILKEQRIYNL
ncbi:diaminopimelate decarboxylase [candidate division TA06 bacterium]|nr:diaminopimelate decarboxylase [candidate division TA06 bacterium]